MDNVKSICHYLCRVVNITLKVYKSGALFENSGFVAFVNGVSKVVHIFVTLANIHIITNTNRVSHK